MGGVWDRRDPSQPPGIPPSRGRCGVFLGHPKSGRSLGTPPCHPPLSGSAWRSEINPWRSSRKSSGAAESPPPLPDPRPGLRGFVTSVTFVTFVTSTPSCQRGGDAVASPSWGGWQEVAAPLSRHGRGSGGTLWDGAGGRGGDKGHSGSSRWRRGAGRERLACGQRRRGRKRIFHRKRRP